LAAVRRQKIGYSFQIYNHIPVFSARDNVAMPLNIEGSKRKEALNRAEQVLEIVGLGDQAWMFPDELSGGE
jgi:putative ABC transport system ATP-binding protein